MTETTQTNSAYTTSTPTPTLNEQQTILIQRLKQANINTKCFLKVGFPDCPIEKEKAAFETDWQNNLYGPENLANYPRWGICSGNFLVLIDTDSYEMYQTISKVLPATFEVTSPRRGLPHRYYVVTDGQVPNKALHIPGTYDEKGRLKAMGEIRAFNQYLVAPGTVINYKDRESGEQKTGMYTVSNNLPIASIQYDAFMNTVKPLIEEDNGNDSQKITAEQMLKGVSEGERHAKGLRYSDHLLGKGAGLEVTNYEIHRFNEKCQPSMSEADLQHILEEAVNFIAKQKGISSEAVIKGWDEHTLNNQQNISEQQQQVDKEHIKLILCPECGATLEPSRKNETGNQLYKCTKCQKETDTPTEKTYKPIVPQSIETYLIEDQDGQKTFNPGKFARKLLDLYFFKTDKTTDIIYVFNTENGNWDPTGEIFIKQVMAETLKENARKHYFEEIRFNIRINTYEDLTPTPDKLIVNNGVLNVLTGKLEDFNVGYFITAKLPVTYNETANYTKIKQFMLDVFGPEQEQTIQEFCGYCLKSGYSIAKILILLGGGFNGKSTFLNLLTALLGKTNCSKIPLQEICSDRFAKADLYLKLANICGDLEKDEITNLGAVKLCTGDDGIRAQKKYGQPFEFWNEAKMIYAANEAPEIKEDTKAVWRRLLPISCTADFSGEKGNPNILNELTTPDQLCAFLKYALEGLQRLIKNNKFTSDKGEEENRAEYLRKSNSSKAWIEERLEYINDPAAWIEADEFYKQYITFCQKEKLPSDGKAQLTKALNQYLPEVNKKQRRVLGKLKWGWANVRAKEDNPFEPTVTSVTTLQTVQNSGLNNIEKDRAVVTVVTPEPSNNRVCGDCGRFHLASCGYIGNNFEKLPADKWAGEMHCWIPKQSELPNPGADIG